jgi:hypothetical protein
MHGKTAKAVSEKGLHMTTKKKSVIPNSRALSRIRRDKIGQDRAQLARDIAALEEQIGVLQARDSELYAELCGLFGNKPANTPKVRKAVRCEDLLTGEEMPMPGLKKPRIWDIRASIVAYLRDAPAEARFSCKKIADAFTHGDTKLAAKALDTLAISCGGKGRGKVYWCEKETESDETAEEEAAE